MKKFRKPLTEKQQKVWIYLLGYLADYDNGLREHPCPSRMEIAEALGIEKYQVKSHIRSMKKKGWIKLTNTKGHWRNIRIIEEKEN